MIIYRNFDSIGGDFTACIGFFDGLHRGHRFLLGHLREEARRNGRKSAVVTFANHPRRVVQPDFELQLIDTLQERLAKLESTGIDACFLLDFTEEVRQMTAETFIREVLSERMHIRQLLIGYDHRFGRNRSEGFEDYVRYGRACGMEVVQEPVLEGEGQRHYSSSEVRRLLLAGNVHDARLLLGLPYQMTGRVEHGHEVGRRIGFPTANLCTSDPDKLVPMTGVYACQVRLADGSSWPAMVNIGQRPTVDDDRHITIEAHVIGYEGDLYDQRVSVRFLDRIRDVRKMAGLEELREQLTRDARATLEVYTNAGNDL